jgi:sialate O-acetylesterase
MQGQAVFSQVRVPRLVSDGMVLQRGTNIRIWGWAGPGEEITVEFDGEKAKTVTNDAGRWALLLGPRKPGGPYNMEIDGINHIELRNVFVGDVWLCSGQSNMEMSMEQVKEKYPEVIAQSKNDLIRQFRVPLRYDFNEPHDNVASGRWEAANPATVLSFSAVAYFFAREIYDRYKVPVGLINNAVGGSPAEAWLDADALREFPMAEAVAARYANSAYRDSIAAADKAAGKESYFQFQPGGLFNGMLFPVVNYTVKGVIWYQGEANVSRAVEYRRLFSALITDWRRNFPQPELPFLFVQLPNYMPVKEQPEESSWAELREAQRLTLSLPLTGMAVTTDLGETNNIHPLNKEGVAKRLFLAAERVAYDKINFISSGPLYHSIHIRHNKIHVSFDDVEGGLIVKGGGELHGFAIAGADNHFVWAKAIISGKSVIVWSDQVPQPVAVRYAWADNPEGANLYNRDALFQDGLPASPFEGRKIPK